MSSTLEESRDTARPGGSRAPAAGAAQPNQVGALGGLMIANATVFTSSFCIMVIELTAGRLIAPYVGMSLHTWTSIIGVVLAGIAGGNYLGGRIADRYAITRQRACRVVALLFIIAGVVTAGIGVYNRISGELTYLTNMSSFRMRIAMHVTLTFFLPSALLGLISPVVAKMALDLGRLAGRTMGSVYAWGVVGSIFGTFMTGFYFVAVMKTSTIVLAVAVLLLVMGALYGLASLRRST